MTDKIYFQWQNKHLRDTIYPVRDMKLRHFLLYFHEIDLWEQYKEKKIEDLPKEKAEYLAAQKRAVTEAYKAEINLRGYFMDTGIDAQKQDNKKAKFAGMLVDIEKAIKDDAAKDEVEWIRDKLVSLHGDFALYFKKFEQEKDDRARDRKERVYVSMRIAVWEQHRKDLKHKIRRRTNLLAVMDEKSKVKLDKKKELDALETIVLPAVESELGELRKFVVAQSRLEKRKVEFNKRQTKYLERETELLSELAEPRKKIEALKAEQKRLEREIARLVSRPTPAEAFHAVMESDLYKTIEGRLSASPVPVDPRVVKTIVDTVCTTIGDEDGGFNDTLRQLVQPWIERGGNTDFAWIVTSLGNQSERLRQAQKKLKNVVLSLEAGLKSMSSGGQEWTIRYNTINVLDDGMMIEILDEQLDKLETLQAAIADSRKDDGSLNVDLSVARTRLKQLCNEISDIKRDSFADEQELEDVQQALHLTRESFLREFVPDGAVDVKKDIVPFKAQQHYQWLEKKDHAELMKSVFERFYKEPERFPLWLQYMVVHFSGMRYASAHGSWADPRDMLLSLRTLDLQDDYKKAWGEEVAEDDPNDGDFSDHEILVACESKIDYYQPLVEETDGKYDATTLTALARAIADKPKVPGRENPAKRRMEEYYLRRLDSENADTRRKALLDLSLEEENFKIREMKPEEVLEQLKAYEEKIPDWMWTEIVKLTDLRLTEVDGKDWETLTAAQQAERLSNQDKKMAKYRDIMNDWKRKNLTGWREEHEQSNRLIVTRAVCNEVAEHIQHLRGHEGASGLTQKPFWYKGEEDKFYQIKPRPKGPRPYFVRAKDRGEDRHLFEVGASLLWLRFVNDSPNEWRIARDMATGEGDELVDAKYLGRNIQGGSWAYKKGEPISRMRQKIDRKGAASGPQEIQYLRWMHEATVAAVAKTHEGTVVLTFETALPSEDPSTATIGVFKRYLHDLHHDQGEDGYNPAFIGFMPEGEIPVKDMEEMLDWNHIMLDDVLTPAQLEAYRKKYIRKRKPTAPTIEFTRDAEEAKPKSVIGLKPLNDFLQWMETIAQPGTNMYRVRRWGDQAFKGGVLSVDVVGTTNFQAVGLYNKGTNDFGAVKSFIYVPRKDVDRLAAMQVEDTYRSKKPDWRSQKMNWLCQHEGSIYMFDDANDSWKYSPHIRWGTLALGGNLVQVDGFEDLEIKVEGFENVGTPTRGGKIRLRMGRLVGFRKHDWNRPLDDLLTEGLVHRCLCAYRNDQIADSPQGIVYSPFYSPLDWDFRGTTQPTSLYIPEVYLEEQGSTSPLPENRGNKKKRK